MGVSYELGTLKSKLSVTRNEGHEAPLGRGYARRTSPIVEVAGGVLNVEQPLSWHAVWSPCAAPTKLSRNQ